MSTMTAPSLAHLAQLPLMKSYSTEELHKIQMFLRDGIISEGLEWISEKKDYGLRHRMKLHALTHGYGRPLTQLACDLPNANSRVQYADLHGPDDQCRIVLILSYPTISARVRPMMLNLRGQFVEPSLAAAVEPWVYILHHMGYNIEYCTQFLYRITCVFDICPISGASDWASKTSTTEHFASVRDRVLDHSKHMFHHLLNLIPREKIQCIAAGAIALEASTYILEGTGVTLVNGDVQLPHPCKGKNGWMTVEERHKYVAHSCKLMSGLVGQEFSIYKLSYNQLDLVYGVCGSLELQWWEEHVDVTAGSEVGYVADLINEKIARECEERTRKEEERARKEEERVREVARLKPLTLKFEEEKEERAKRLQQWMKKEEEEKCVRKEKEEGMNSDSPQQDNLKSRKIAQKQINAALLREKVKSIMTKALEELDEVEARIAQKQINAALLREKVKSIKTKAPEELDEVEARLIKNVDERRIHNNARKRERRAGRGAVIEMFMSKPEEDRTEEEQELIAAEERRKEGARQREKKRRERGRGGRAMAEEAAAAAVANLDSTPPVVG
jgi:hypothetical protein